MFLESETDLTLTLAIAAAVGLIAAVFFLILLVRTAAALSRVRTSLSATSVGADRTEQRMFTILQAIPVALVETDTSGKFTFANRAAHQLLGRKDAELLGLRFHSATWGITYPDGRMIPPDLLPAARALRGQTVKGFQHMMVNPSTRRKMLVSVTAMPIMNDVGEVVGSSSAIVETESLSTPQADPEELLRSRYFDVAGVMLLALNRDGTVRDINLCGAELLGAPAAEIIGRDWIRDFLPLEDQKEARAFFDDVVEGKREMPEQGEGWIIRADGVRRLLSWRGALLRDERDRIAGTLSSGLDLTDARAAEAALREKEDEALIAKAAAEEHEGRLGEAEKALRESEAQFHSISEALGEVVWLYDPGERKMLHVSRAYDAIWGDSRDLLIADAKHWRTLAHPDDLALIDAANEQLDRGEPRAIEFRIRRASDGEERILHDSAFVLAPAEEGAPRRIAGVARDVTDARRAQAALGEAREALQQRMDDNERSFTETRTALEQRLEDAERALEAAGLQRQDAESALERSQRFETVGRLTGGVAHDLGSLLTVVVGALDMMLHQAEKPERIRRLGSAALAATRRGERLVSQLSSFSQGESFKLETLALEPVLRGFEPMLRRAVDETKPLAIETSGDLGCATFDAAQLEAALVNLALNAKEAVRGGGSVVVRADRVRLAESQIADTPAGEYARLSVIDTGVGMNADIAARAFEPFFTTKSEDEATGLGLAQVYGFARQSGGGVGIDSAPGAGSTVSIYLPIVEAATEAAAHQEAPAAAGA